MPLNPQTRLILGVLLSCLVLSLIVHISYKQSMTTKQTESFGRQSLLSPDPVTGLTDDEKQKTTEPTKSTYSLRELICKEDKQLVDQIIHMDVKNKAEYLRLITKPVQSACKSRLRLGGHKAGASAWDGHKFVCEDDLEGLIGGTQSCLVYSFGISGDLSFENQMAAIGCTVHAYDHTIKSLPATSFPHKIHWHKVGMASNNDKSDLKTLGYLIGHNGHSNDIIHYLKVDIEGEERNSIPEWIRSGSLANVKQIGIEFHQGDNGKNFQSYAEITKLLSQHGFKLISWDPNMVVTSNLKSGPYSCFEVVFRKTELIDCRGI
ncbi:uncharacterized protein LOC134845744 [Symsagittifera roscoffensis]|uniref:uncharacterized protein LOC134845744 n=1 Tax=Symsagittifera roscoffensis TaxID=84072 RepID=UPI00307CA0DD